ncbi:MAG TPA: HAD family hydrolase [Cellvibrio sp.]|nr:HAD family hydrolase [Cellvibrio sp.]
MTPDLLERARRIKLLILDVDGVLTDGKLYFSNTGDELKTFCTLDGHGIKLLQGSGVKVAIITGRTSALVAKRAKDLGIELLIQGREDKWVALQENLDNSISLEEIAFMGDDWPDLSVMSRVGLALTVPNAHISVLDRAHWQSKFHGGQGAVREACDLIMQAQGTFDAALAHYLPTHH